MITLNEVHVVVAENCSEPEGDFKREIRPMPLTVENLHKFWEKSRQFRTVFGDEVNGDFKKFCELFISMDDDDKLRAHGLFWVIDDFVGVFYLTNMTDVEATCHYTFFDRRHLGREQLTRSMLRYVFDKFRFRRLNVEVPMYASKHTFGFTTALGFLKEGRKRKASFYKNDWFDIAMFGLLREELENNGS